MTDTLIEKLVKETKQAYEEMGIHFPPHAAGIMEEFVRRTVEAVAKALQMEVPEMRHGEKCSPATGRTSRGSSSRSTRFSSGT